MLDLTQYDQVFVLTDEQAAQCCLPVFHSLHCLQPILANHVLSLSNSQPCLADIPTLVLPSGEQHKNLSSVQRIWDFLFAHNATRASLLINIGGGVICDMGGFAAATYKRGIAFMNIPTTLLAMVDAATGGKTGIDYTPMSIVNCQLSIIKNAIGVFAEPVDTIIEPRFLATLPPEQLLSGFAEMLKHALLMSPKAFAELIDYDLREVTTPAFGELIRQSVAFKQSITSQDPHDNGLRQQLNFGHTVGHAIESLLLEKNLQLSTLNSPTSFNSQLSTFNYYLHGYCVLYGLVAESYLSHALCGLPAEVVSTLSRFMMENYGAAPITCKDYDRLLQLMQHDKKNREQGAVTCTLLSAIGQPVIGQTIPPDLLRESIEYLCSL